MSNLRVSSGGVFERWKSTLEKFLVILRMALVRPSILALMPSVGVGRPEPWGFDRFRYYHYQSPQAINSYAITHSIRIGDIWTRR